MHILITADTVGGVWTYSRELAAGLLERGMRVTLVSFGDLPSAAQTEWMDRLGPEQRKLLAYYPTAFKLEWMQDCDADMRASADFLLGVIHEVKPDLLHLSQYYFGALRCNLPRVVVAHSDVVSWWASIHGSEPPASSWMSWYRDVVGRGLREATAVVAPSQWMLDQLEAHYGGLSHASVIYNGRSPGLFSPYKSKENLILTVGRLWDAGKNAALMLREEMPAPVLIVGADHHPGAGNGPFSVETRAGVTVEPHKNEKQLAQAFGRASIYAALSRYEPFGLAPLEAALSRCAIVASDIPTFRELWAGAAMFFHENDPQDLRSALELLVRDPELRNHYAALAYRYAVRKFSAGRMVDAYHSLYRTIAPMAAAA